MPFRSLIATLLWMSYALLLGHDVLPHHHHDEETIAHQGIPDADHPDADHSDTDQHGEGEDEPDWWFAHQHAPGANVFKTDTQLTQTIPVVAILVDQYQLSPAAPGTLAGSNRWLATRLRLKRPRSALLPTPPGTPLPFF